MPVQHILAPIDFSDRSEGAGRYAEVLSRIFHCRITLLHVLTPPHYEIGAMEVGGAVLEELFEQRSRQARKQLSEFLQSEMPGDLTNRVLLEGDPASRIVQLAHDEQVSLIIMPTHGYGPFRRFILGSVTAKVLHDADCPVWTGVHLAAASVEAIHLKTVVAAIDFGPQSERVLMWASRFAEATGAVLKVIHATPNLEGKAGEYFDPDWKQHLEAAARDEANKLLDRLNLKAEVLFQNGDPARAVCHMAKELPADVLVIGRGSASGVFGRMRANAYSIIRLSHCPVVSV